MDVAGPARPCPARAAAAPKPDSPLEATVRRDALPFTDLGVMRAAEQLGITDLATTAQHWRPWRSYATQYLWATLPHPINQLPEAS